MNDETTMTAEQKAKLKFEKRVLERLRLRPTADGAVFTLDLRTKGFAGVSNPRPTLYCPDDPEWPLGGRTTDDRSEATRWVTQRYAEWIREQVVQPSSDASVLTWRQGAEKYIDSFKIVERRADGTTIETIPPNKRSRVSMIRRHVIPAFGHLPMAAVDREMVGKEAASLKVKKSEGRGKKASKDGAHGTKIGFKAALQAIWSYNFKYRPAPFAGVKIDAPAILPGLSTEVFAFDDESDFLDDSTGALEPNQILRALVAAMWYDLEMMKRPNTKWMMIPNTAHAMAIAIGLGTRISEERNIRWGHANFKKMYVQIHNAKVHQVRVAKRAVPLQWSLVPWFDDLRTMSKVQPNDFMIRSDPNAPGTVQATQNSIARRIAFALELAGLKRDGKATHGMRATFASILHASDDINEKMTKCYLGHQAVYGCSTDVYVRQLIEAMKESHRHLIKLPTPEEVRAALAEFKPEDVPSWRERKNPWPRSKAAQEERAKRGKRVPLGASLDLPNEDGDSR